MEVGRIYEITRIIDNAQFGAGIYMGDFMIQWSPGEVYEGAIFQLIQGSVNQVVFRKNTHNFVILQTSPAAGGKRKNKRKY